jgi:hypothetical protein
MTTTLPEYANLPNWPTDRLKKRRAQAAKKRAEKLAVARKHPVGTSWRTRAERDAAGYQERIDIIDRILAERQDD